MTISIIPLSPNVAQSFTSQLGYKMYGFEVIWNDRSEQFSMSITDDATGVLLVADIALVLGVELLSPFNLGMGAMICYDESRSGKEATVDDLGSRVNLYWFSEDEYQ